LQIHPEQYRVRLHEKQLLDVVDDLCRFIMHEVVNVRGKFFYEAQVWQRKINTLDFVSGTINGTVPPLVAFLERNRGKTCIQCAL
jgi:hypothetical protein